MQSILELAAHYFNHQSLSDGKRRDLSVTTGN